MKSSRWFTCGVRTWRFGAILALAGFLSGWSGTPAHAYDCPPRPSSQPGPNYSVQTLDRPNFSHQDLTNANFKSAHLSGANFVGANLTGADFSFATIDTPDPAIPSDFSFANLTSACFIGATIGNPTYFTYATLTCADFSQTNLNDNNNAIFGESLTIAKDPGNDPNKLSCRTAFRAATMNCEFIDDWRWLDLSSADIDHRTDIGACLTLLKGKDFSEAKMANVNFSDPDPNKATDLGNTKWNSADLTGATFTGSKLDGADFTGATLTAAVLDYIQAKGTIFTGAHLMADQVNGKVGAHLDFAYLEDVRFDGADLSYAYFAYATLTGPNVTLSKATLTGSDWQNANLSGIDLTGLTAYGANLTGANLANTTLKNTALSYNTFNATGTSTLAPAELVHAYFCGATLDATVLTCADLTNAYILGKQQQVIGPDGKETSCDATTITTTPTGQYSPKTDGVSTPKVTCSTLCPDGTNGPCTTQAQWQFRDTGPIQCCVTTQGGAACPPRKRAGKPCTSDCDCHSKNCSAGVCADDAALIEALKLKRAGQRP